MSLSLLIKIDKKKKHLITGPNHYDIPGVGQSILDLIFVANFVGKWVSVNFYVFCDCAGGGPLFCDGINYDLVKS